MATSKVKEKKPDLEAQMIEVLKLVTSNTDQVTAKLAEFTSWNERVVVALWALRAVVEGNPVDTAHAEKVRAAHRAVENV